MAWSSTVRRNIRISSPLLAGLGAFALIAAAPDYDVAAQGEAGASQYQDRVDYSSVEDWSDEIPAHLSVVDGAVTLEREGRGEAAEENILLLAGDRLRTDRGRAEVLFADGSSLAIDEYSTVDLQDDALMRLLAGRARLSIARATGGIEYRIDSPAGSALIRTPGDYRLAVYDSRTSAAPEFELSVLRGSAELVNERGRTLVRAGTRAVMTANAAPSLPYAFNSAAADGFDRWTESIRDARLGYESTRYLPSDIGYYAGAFDQYGGWEYQPTYGYVWYPRVAADWRPYSYGRWSFTARYGWFWVGADRWSWATHHYGRWGLSGARWYWIPDRRWGPAWVSWASAPGYVGWCPLGFDGRPVISFTYISGRSYDRWSGWTVMPSRSFTANVLVTRHAVAGRSLGADVVNRFAVGTRGPDGPAGASRARAIRTPGATRYAVPRGTAVASPSLRTEPGRAIAPSSSPSRASAGASTAPRGAASQRRTAPSSRDSMPSRSAESSRTTSPGVTRAVPRSQPSNESRASGSTRGWTPPETITSRPSPAPARPGGSGSVDSPASRGSERAPSRTAEPRGGYRVAEPPSRPSGSSAPPSRGISPPGRTSAPSRSSGAPPRTSGAPPRTSGAPPRGTAPPSGRAVPRSGSGGRGGGSEAGSTPPSGGTVQSSGDRQAPPSAPSRGRAVPRGGRGGGG